MVRIDSIVADTTLRTEQAWNAAQLAEPVTEPSWRLWTYRCPGVVFGCSQHAMHAQSGLGPSAVVRNSGGGAVLVGPWMLSASVVLPPVHPLLGGGLIASYRWLGTLHASLLRGIGIDARTISPEQVRLHVPDVALGWACYGGLSPWEVVVGRRKIVGLAQSRRRTGVLFSAGMLVATPEWALLCNAAGQPPGHGDLLAQCTTSCEQELEGRVLVASIAGRLQHMLKEAIEVHSRSDPLVDDGYRTQNHATA